MQELASKYLKYHDPFQHNSSILYTILDYMITDELCVPPFNVAAGLGGGADFNHFIYC